MLIRIKFEGKSRKLSEKVTTVSDLKKKITELFGTPGQGMQIVYKDCDGELVDVMDDDDLRNCYNEAQDLKQESLTFVVKQRRTGSRSASSGEEKGPEPRRGREEPRAEGTREGELHGLKKMLFKLDYLSRACIGENAEDPLAVLGSVFKQLETDCPGLGFNPKLLGAAFANARGELAQALKKGYTEAVSKNPELAKLNEEALKNWQEFKQNAKFRRRGPGGVIGKQRSDSEGMEHQSREPGHGQDRAERFDRSGHHFEDRERHFDRPRGYNRGRFNGPRRGDFDRPREDRRFPPHRPDRDDRRPADFGGKDEALINERVRRLCHQFPSKSKHELRAIVAQNIEKTPQQLEAMIMQSRKAKSSFY